MTVILSHLEYWRIIKDYHMTDSSKKPAVLSGYVRAQATFNPDIFTRMLLTQFLLKEMQSYGELGPVRL